MEATPLALAIFSTFNAIVEDIHLLQVGLNFERDYHTSILKLANIQCRLTRWGKPLGLTADVVTGGQVLEGVLDKLQPESERELAAGNLEHIHELIGKIRRKSADYGGPKEAKGKDLAQHLKTPGGSNLAIYERI